MTRITNVTLFPTMAILGGSVLLASCSGILLKSIPSFSASILDWNPALESPLDMMKAVVYGEHGGSEVLRLVTTKRPVPRKGQLLLRVAASSVNPVDFKTRRNKVPAWILPKPKIPGADLAGTVVEVGSNTKGWAAGDRVVAMMPLYGSKWGSHAEYVAIDSSLVASLPDTIDFQSAAGLPLVSLTVLQCLDHLNDTFAYGNKKILVHAGAGGVGTIAIQYAKHVLGMYVATTASAKKAHFLKELGADLVIDYHKEDFSTVLRDYDVVLDPMSFLYEDRTLQSSVLKPDGHYLNIVSSDWSLGKNGKERVIGVRTALNFVKYKVTTALWPRRRKYDICVVSPNGKQLQSIVDLVRDGTIRPIVDRVFPLSELPTAHRYLESGRATGKLVIQHDTHDDSMDSRRVS